MKTVRRSIASLGLALMSGCSTMQGQPFDPTLAGRAFYLCCNIAFKPDRVASDANYWKYRTDEGYKPSPLLAAGTRVRVAKVGESAVEFQPSDATTTYTVVFKYGRGHLSASQYFHNILRDENPVDAMQDVPPSIADAVREGRLVVGMTKAQTLIARGYPPAHRTPSLEATEWLYFDTPGFVDRVTFADDRIQSVILEPVPQ